MILVKVAETREEKQACLDIRRVVFIEGQKVPKNLEIDGLDNTAYHWIAFKDGESVGTARVIKTDDGTTAKIQRVAVLEACRGLGVGRQIMEVIEQDDRLSFAKHYKLGAQTHAIPFYETLGYMAYGPEYDDAGIPHLDMKKARVIKDDNTC